jgi:hypothetical protein
MKSNPQKILGIVYSKISNGKAKRLKNSNIENIFSGPEDQFSRHTKVCYSHW